MIYVRSFPRVDTDKRIDLNYLEYRELTMALGKKSGCLKSKSVVSAAADKELDFGVVRYARGLGRKRVVISCNQEDSSIDLTPKAPSKRRCSVVGTTVDADWSLLEVLPQEILVSTITKCS